MNRPEARRAPKQFSLLAPLLAMLLLAMAGCGPTVGKPSLDEGQARALWRSFVSPGENPARSFTLSASLSVQSPARSARLLVRFWGDLERPLRLDLSTGMGQTFAMWREDSLGWMAVYPLENRAFTHSSTKAALSRLGMPFPFGLKELAAISTGRYGLILPESFRSVTRTQKGYEYTFPASSPVSRVTLDDQGVPVAFVGQGIEPWTVELADPEPTGQGSKPLPRRITVTTPGGLKAILRIKTLEYSAEAAPVKGLELAFPPSAEIVPLDRPGDFRAPGLP